MTFLNLFYQFANYLTLTGSLGLVFSTENLKNVLSKSKVNSLISKYTGIRKRDTVFAFQREFRNMNTLTKTVQRSIIKSKNNHEIFHNILIYKLISCNYKVKTLKKKRKKYVGTDFK